MNWDSLRILVFLYFIIMYPYSFGISIFILYNFTNEVVVVVEVLE